MKSLWELERGSYPALKGLIKTQVLVIGGGMAGVLCARKLQGAGKQVVLVEANQIGSGITAKTTAVLTAQHDTLYQDLIQQFGTDTARYYLHDNLRAVERYRQMAETIPCDFQEAPSVQYTTSDSQVLRTEAETVKRLGFNAEFVEKVPLDIPVAGAVVYPHMAQFHPLKFLYGAVEGLTVYEHSRVLDLDGTTAYLEQGRIEAQQVIVATHFPLLDRRGLYFLKLYQNRSYVVALRNAPELKVTMAELNGQGIYFRSYQDLLLVGGGDHRTGKKSGFSQLKQYIHEHFPEAKQEYVWANQDCMSLDGLPYVGHYSPKWENVYVATGFNAWGMTNSMVAAELLTDMICGRKNPMEDILNPARSLLHKQLWRNIGTTLGDFAIPSTKRCPHLGCTLKWNPQEHSWDCPCHGSRFGENGSLLDTPAQKDAEV